MEVNTLRHFSHITFAWSSSNCSSVKEELNIFCKSRLNAILLYFLYDLDSTTLGSDLSMDTFVLTSISKCYPAGQVFHHIGL